jgi:hypothetical protein
LRPRPDVVDRSVVPADVRVLPVRADLLDRPADAVDWREDVLDPPVDALD